VAGLGKNYMTERSRVAAIKGYSFFIRFYALNEYWAFLQACMKQKGLTIEAAFAAAAAPTTCPR
jgi:hypothetical protein